MTWIIIGLVLVVVHILLLKNAMCIRVYGSNIAYPSYRDIRWIEDRIPKIPYWIIFIIFLVCSIPYFGIHASICFWVSIFVSSLINTKGRRTDYPIKVLVFQVPTITNFLTKEI